MAGVFRPQRGSPGFEADWEEIGRGYSIKWKDWTALALSVEAAKRAIDEISQLGAETARELHPWISRTGQTEESVYWKEAEIEFPGTTPRSTPHVWGEWGVEDRPRYLHETDEDGNLRPTEVEENVSTKDVAMFLEFGTIKMEPRPWLYPAWDATKGLLPAAVRAHREALVAVNWRPGMGSGAFMSFETWFMNVARARAAAF